MPLSNVTDRTNLNSDGIIDGYEYFLLYGIINYDNSHGADAEYVEKEGDDWAAKLQAVSDSDIDDFYGDNVDNLDLTFLYGLDIDAVVADARKTGSTAIKNDIDKSNGLKNGVNPADARAIKNFLGFIGQDTQGKTHQRIIDDLKTFINDTILSDEGLKDYFQQKINEYSRKYNLDNAEKTKLVALVEDATGLDL